MQDLSIHSHRLSIPNNYCYAYTMVDQNPIDDPQSDDDHPIPSSRSELLMASQSRSVNAQNADDQLILRTAYKAIQPNNHCLDFDNTRTHFPVLHEILKRHPLAFAFNEIANTFNSSGASSLMTHLQSSANLIGSCDVLIISEWW